MATSKSFFGIRRGTAMGMVFSKGEDGQGKSQQVTRALPESVKNPRTSTQMQQRALMAAAMKSYSMLKALADHSMEGKTYGQQSMSEFLRVNYRAALSAPNTAVGFPWYKDPYDAVFEGTVLAKGSLDEPAVHDELDVSYNNVQLDTGVYGTESEIVQAFGLKNVGDVFTIAFIVVNNDSVAGVESTGARYIQQKQLAYSRLKLMRAPYTDAGDGKELDTLFDTSDSANVVIDLLNGSVFDWDFPTAIGGYGEEARVQLISCVASQKTTNGWLRSNSVFRNAFGDTSDPAIFFEINKAQAIATFPVGAAKILNGADMTRAAVSSVTLGAYQITDNASPNKGEWYLGANVDGVKYLVGSVTSSADEDDQALGQAVKLGNTVAEGSLKFTPSPWGASSTFETSETGWAPSTTKVLSVNTLRGYINDGNVTNLRIGATSPIAASTLPVLNSL